MVVRDKMMMVMREMNTLKRRKREKLRKQNSWASREEFSNCLCTALKRITDEKRKRRMEKKVFVVGGHGRIFKKAGESSEEK
jgi:hypothetical protein